MRKFTIFIAAVCVLFLIRVVMFIYINTELCTNRSKRRKFYILDQISIEDIDYRYTDGFLRCGGRNFY